MKTVAEFGPALLNNAQSPPLAEPKSAWLAEARSLFTGDLKELRRILVIELDAGSWLPYFAQRSQKTNLVYFYEPQENVSAPPFWEGWNPELESEIWAEAYSDWLAEWFSRTGGRLPRPLSGPVYPELNGAPAEIKAQLRNWYFSWEKLVGKAVTRRPPPKNLRAPV